MSALDPRDRSIIEGIARNCDSIEARLERYGIDGEVFASDADLREMVLFPLIQIGELANHLSAEFIRSHGQVPWSDVVGMRHIVVHGYDALDVSWAWSTISRDIPPLKDACREYLAEDELVASKI